MLENPNLEAMLKGELNTIRLVKPNKFNIYSLPCYQIRNKKQQQEGRIPMILPFSETNLIIKIDKQRTHNQKQQQNGEFHYNLNPQVS